ncbi:MULTISPECIES: SRPBCC family protein [unclassified Lysobacter]|uniref:SRPBCC family protein n=1 Tax=unclassified Lysobacter TaxID=2635362 RepID=UPI00070B8E3D|nr:MULTISPECIES: SRPBCC family protein [unclassified Lysobacter]KRD39438.1 polyketide cyclase [Lysobacter sp. Root916]KRD79409.1 polyketide cyclase [Lysobacter sp. Root983]
MLALTLSLLALIVVAVLIYAATRPSTLHIERSLVIHAPAETILAHVNDFRRWRDWSPYEKLEPDMRREIGGAASGRGATYAWEGKGKAGAGRMEITDTRTDRTTIQLDFSKPFVSHNIAEFAAVAQADATRVTWTMQGPAAYMTKLMGVFFNMDRMIGRDFETGLASLKALSEK